VDIKWVLTLVVACLAAASTLVFFGLAALGNEWRLRNEEWAPDEPDWSAE
jgi:hypothetical protein